MTWKTIRLELSRTSTFPNGSAGRAYLIRAPLDEHGSIDPVAVKQNPTEATVRRFWAAEPDQYGQVELANGRWVFRMNGVGETIGRLGPEPIQLHDQITVEDADGTVLPFRVVSIRDLRSPAIARP